MAAVEEGRRQGHAQDRRRRELTVEVKDGAIWVWDAKGDTAKITIKNVIQSNGVIHVIDTVLLPS